MKTKYWVILIAVVLLVCIGLSLLILLPGENATRAEVYLNGELVQTVDLRMNQEFTLESDRGTNVITVRDGKIAVTEASCPDHHCMNRGYCSGGTAIVCLPNKLVIEFVDGAEVDAAVG